MTKIAALSSELEETKDFLDKLARVKFIKMIDRIMPGKYGWISSELKKYNRFNLNQTDYDLVNDSNLFDASFYSKYQPDLTPFSGDPLKHFLLHGGFKGLSPNRLFDTTFYFKQCPELTNETINPLVHYLSAGTQRGINPCYLFDTQYYLENNPEISENGENPLSHYLTVGGKKGIDPHPVFDTNYYYKQCTRSAGKVD